MLKENLLSKDFYLDKMSMFLKDSFGMIDREEVYRLVLNNVNDVSDDLISHYDIYNILYTEDYFERNVPEGMTAEEYANSTKDEILDRIAAIFGIQRTFNISYAGQSYQGHYYGTIGETVTKTLTLTNRELLVYIKVVITKLNYRGTAQEIVELYNDDGNKDLQNLQIFYSWGSSPLVCNVYLCNFNEISRDNYDSHLVELFLSDLLLVESLGVQYNKILTQVMFTAVFDVEPDLANYKYIFDPDFTNQNQPTFQYAIFSDDADFNPIPQKNYTNIFDVDPDIANYKYTFDPDFEHEDEEGFEYASFI